MEETEFLKSIIERMATELGTARKNELILTAQNENFIKQHERIIAELQEAFEAEKKKLTEDRSDHALLSARCSALESEVNRLNDALSNISRLRDEALHTTHERDERIAVLQAQIDRYLSTMNEKETELKTREEATRVLESTIRDREASVFAKEAELKTREEVLFRTEAELKAREEAAALKNVFHTNKPNLPTKLVNAPKKKLRQKVDAQTF